MSHEKKNFFVTYVPFVYLPSVRLNLAEEFAPEFRIWICFQDQAQFLFGLFQ